jgi:hypothetical protein
VSLLYPDTETEHIADLPATLFDAVRLGLGLVKMQENVPEEDMPPRDIWMEPDLMKEHFAAVKKRRDDEARGENNQIDGPVEKNRLVDELLV